MDPYRKSQIIATVAGGIAHEVKNQLVAVFSPIEFLLSKADLAPGLKEDLHSAYNCARRSAEIANRLSLYCRHSPVPDQIPLQAMLRNVIQALSQEQGIQLQPADPGLGVPATACVYMDQTWLRQLLNGVLYLIGKNHPPNQPLSISATPVQIPHPTPPPPQQPGHFIRLSLLDEGPSEPISIHRILDPSYPLAEFGRGRCLHLLMGYSLLLDAGGWLDYSSNQRGNLFHLHLPTMPKASPPKAAQPPLPPAAADPATLEGTETILVVDDEEVVRLVAKTVLKYRGYKVLEASDGEEALLIYQKEKHQIHLVLLDLHLPKQSGWAALEKLRRLSQDVGIILFSGDAPDEFRRRALASGANDYIQKPFENYELVSAIRRVLDAKSKTSP